ncbi:hypothetical protein ACQUY5_29320 [Bacillus cereus]|uniref:hypothetical protein n=1 Tax=Bacillus cereus TaxID=1396 RepID=UPI003D16853C
MRTKQLHIPFERGEYAFGYIEVQDSGYMKPNLPFSSKIKEGVYLNMAGFQRDFDDSFFLLMEVHKTPTTTSNGLGANESFILESKDIDISNEDPIYLEKFDGDMLDFPSYVKERLKG